MRRKNLAIAFIVSLVTIFSGYSQTLESGFVNPPDSARPWVYWFWLNGNLSKEGVTADLEAMKRVGIGGVLIMEVDQGTPKGKYVFGSAEWRELFKFMLAEANRLGLKVNMNNDAGWCGSGGPWMTVDKSMQKLTWSDTTVIGPKKFTGKLKQPPTVNNYYEDIIVLAYPTPEGDDKKLSDYNPAITCSNAESNRNAKNLADNDLKTLCTFPRPSADHIQSIDFRFGQPFTSRTLSLYASWAPWPVIDVRGSLQISEDGKSYKTIGEFKGGAPVISIDYPEISAKYYRINFFEITKEDSKTDSIAFKNIAFTNSRIQYFEEKAMYLQPNKNITVSADYPAVSARFAIPGSKVINISSAMKADGSISWTTPKGKWTIVRLGHTTTGKFNHPAPEGGLGYECDKMSKEASTLFINGLISKLADDSRPLVGKSFVSTHIDSWEVGSQNWTPGFFEEFKKRCGYDIMPYLPVMLGRIVDNIEVSERFLWDLRQTISEMMLENYVDNIRNISHSNGLRLSIEAYDKCMTDEMTYAGRADEPMAEFWSWYKYGFSYSCSEMPSAAHVYGKKIIGAEAFTANGEEKWLGHPAMIKDLGDWAFCEGINRFVFHRYAMQPYENIKPGISMGPWGLHYERTQTWWEQSVAWHQYLARCQYLLQQGLFVADVLYLAPENSPQSWHPKDYSDPSEKDELVREKLTYNFDGCPADALISRATAANSKIVFPDGMSYHVLVLSSTEIMSLQLMRKIKELVNGGAVVIGNPPQKATGLSGYPQSDEEMKKLTAELWGNCDGITVTEHSYGKGKIIMGRKPEEVLAAMGITRDFSADKRLRYIHKTIGDNEVYFISNPELKDVNATCSFRIAGKTPEIWNPVNGRIIKTARYSAEANSVSLPITFDPYGSAFVIFKKTNGTGVKVKTMTCNGSETDSEIEQVSDKEISAVAFKAGKYSITTSNDSKYEFEIKKMPEPLSLNGPWNISFTSGMGAPAKTVFDSLLSWNHHKEDKIRYYSGTAVYTKTITIPKSYIAKNRLLTIDLGKVAVMAEVTLNGKNLGILWRAPYSIDISAAAKAGENILEVKVVNLWINRLIGDEQIPDESKRDMKGSHPVWSPPGSLQEWPQWVIDGKSDPSGRNTFTTWKLWKKDDILVESGLMGPVKIVVEGKVSIPVK